MRRLVLALAGLGLGLGSVPVALAQGRADVQVDARSSMGGADPSCLLAIRLRNAGDQHITVHVTDVEAVDARSGAPLRLNQPQIPFSGVEPGLSRAWTTAAVLGAPCERVRLRVTRVTCSPRCGQTTWQVRGVAAFDPPQP
mgnify:CR=1 FL=1